jgi:hypothetical protein
MYLISMQTNAVEPPPGHFSRRHLAGAGAFHDIGAGEGAGRLERK